MARPASLVVERLSVSEKISIMVGEYNTLHAEIVARTNSRYNIASIGLVVLTLLLRDPVGVKFYMSLFAVLSIVLASILHEYKEIGKCAKYRRFLINKVNLLAREELLGYEAKFGAAKTDPIFRLLRMDRDDDTSIPNIPKTDMAGYPEG